MSDKSDRVVILTFEAPNKRTTPPIALTENFHLEELLAEIDRQYHRNHRQIVINITSVTKIDGGAFIALMNKRSKDGIRICFYDMQRSVRNILTDVPELSVVFDIYGSEEAAVKSFKVPHVPKAP